MFENVGQKIKQLTQVLFWIAIVLLIGGAIVLIIGGIFSSFMDAITFTGILIVLIPFVLCIMLWAFLCYGFGIIVEKTEIDKQLEKSKRKLDIQNLLEITPKGEITGIRAGTGTIPTAFEIPENVYGIPVRAIGEKAFCGYYIESVTIPKGVGKIGKGAFLGCKILKYVSFADPENWKVHHVGTAEEVQETKLVSSKKMKNKKMKNKKMKKESNTIEEMQDVSLNYTNMNAKLLVEIHVDKEWVKG